VIKVKWAFKDKNGLNIELAFQQEEFELRPRHVWVICRYQNKWLFTKHKKRGLEFPGGKVEKGESLVNAAKRETFEETGGIIHKLEYIGEYKVYDYPPFVKAIFFAEIERLIEKDHFLETDGAFLWSGDLKLIQNQEQFSFMMKDQVLLLSMDYLEKNHFIEDIKKSKEYKLFHT
jgi:8-oxo-dGTP diphosphatase